MGNWRANESLRRGATRAGSAAVVLALLGAGGASAAYANDEVTAIDTIERIAPEALDGYAVDSDSVSVPADTATPVTVDLDGTTIQIELPFADAAAGVETVDGVPVYDNGNDSQTVPVAKADGSVQILTVIESQDAPVRYDYALTIPDGGAATLLDGFVTITDSEGAFVAGVTPPWARGADGADVATHYELNGTVLTQVVDHDSDAAYPVVADPWLGANLWGGIATSSEAGQPRYLLARSAWGVAVSQGAAGGLAGAAAGQQIMLGAGWSEAVGLVPALTSKASLKQQYDCHVFYAAFKPDSWNLEKHRANNPGWGSNPLTHLCNW